METIHLHRHDDTRLSPDESPLPPLGRALNVLLVWPRFSASFWSLSGIMELLPQECSHPPLGLITVAALCPAGWTLRLSIADCRR